MAKDLRKNRILQGVSYARVSTINQLEDRNGFKREDDSPKAQMQRCIQFIEFKNNRNSASKYAFIEHLNDPGYSGKDTNRPAYNRLWQLIAERRINFVVASELSRLSRSVMDFLEFIQHCQRHDVEVMIIGLDLDTSTPFGRMMIVILIALAQFEREMTSKRVKDAALIRLVKDGKINGSAEILGLVRDVHKRGHFIIDPDGLQTAELLMKMFVRFSSKQKVIEEAKALGIKGKSGKPIIMHNLSVILENARWRYRGLWYVNKENERIPDSELPEEKRFKAIPLPHGQLLPTELLDEVDAKLKDTYEKKKRSGKDNYIYLLSNVLRHEDESKFGGQPGKDRQYRYYYNAKHKIRIRCDELDPIILKRVKEYLTDNDVFPAMVRRAIERQHAELPSIATEMATKEKALAELDLAEKELNSKLLDSEVRNRPGFMDWLENQVTELKAKRLRLRSELETLKQSHQTIMDRSGFPNLEKALKEFSKGFDELSRVQQRSLIEKIIREVRVLPGNKLEIRIYGEPPNGVRRKQSTDSELNGRAGGI